MHLLVLFERNQAGPSQRRKEPTPLPAKPSWLCWLQTQFQLSNTNLEWFRCRPCPSNSAHQTPHILLILLILPILLILLKAPPEAMARPTLQNPTRATTLEGAGSLITRLPPSPQPARPTFQNPTRATTLEGAGSPFTRLLPAPLLPPSSPPGVPLSGDPGPLRRPMFGALPQESGGPEEVPRERRPAAPPLRDTRGA
jgi:hypothetical protein